MSGNWDGLDRLVDSAEDKPLTGAQLNKMRANMERDTYIEREEDLCIPADVTGCSEYYARRGVDVQNAMLVDLNTGHIVYVPMVSIWRYRALDLERIKDRELWRYRFSSAAMACAFISIIALLLACKLGGIL